MAEKSLQAFIEGAYHDDWARRYYSQTEIMVTEDSDALFDGTYHYQLYKKADFGEDVWGPLERFKACIRGLIWELPTLR